MQLHLCVNAVVRKHDSRRPGFSEYAAIHEIRLLYRLEYRVQKNHSFYSKYELSMLTGSGYNQIAHGLWYTCSRSVFGVAARILLTMQLTSYTLNSSHQHIHPIWLYTNTFYFQNSEFLRKRVTAQTFHPSSRDRDTRVSYESRSSGVPPCLVWPCPAL